MIRFLTETQAGCRRLFPRHLLHRITTLVFLIVSAVIPQLIYTPPLQANQADRPNIVLIMADDMGMGDTSAYQKFTGNSDEDQIHTPQMEKLARTGVLFTDAHTPGSRCSPTRYGLLTGRYPWRNRLKYWVLFGAQGDPMIERDRPTLATLFRDRGYRTGMVGKWHVGLRYRKSDGQPAASFADADLRQPLFDSPLDHGFDYCRFTSRSHGTSGPEPGENNRPDQTIGPGHIHGRDVIGATDNGRQIASSGSEAYVLHDLGGRHSDHAVEFLDAHMAEHAQQPFFLYYPSNSNHGPYTPDTEVGGQPVQGASRNVAGQPMDTRSDFVYENDVALGRLISYLEKHADPRNPGHKLIENSIVVFTSDNGAERNNNINTGPFRSNKGSAYEGGHRVPFIVSWPAGGVGDGNAETAGQVSSQLIGLHDMFATFSEILGADLPRLRVGEKGGEDSRSVLAAWKGEELAAQPMFYHDHKEAKDPAVSAFRLDNPVVNGEVVKGQWKMFFDASLIRLGEPHPIELYDLSQDPMEKSNLIGDSELKPLVEFLVTEAQRHRNIGGHRYARTGGDERITFNWQSASHADNKDHQVISLADRFQGASTTPKKIDAPITMTVTVSRNGQTETEAMFDVNLRGMGVTGGTFKQIDDGEAIHIQFGDDVLIESVTIVAGNGQAGGHFQMGERSPLAIYCIDDDIDSKDQSGILSDLGVLLKGETLRFDSSPHFGVEAPGRWRLGAITVRRLTKE